jgi:formiminotetrahydrofolate cyclodeaminase
MGKLINFTLGGFADEVGGPSPAPGGGSVAAYAGCIGASLVSMVCHLTIGKKGFEASQEELRSRQATAEDLRARLLVAVDVDTDAYLQVAGAYRLPKDTPEERAARNAAVAAAMRHASDVALATAEACLEVIELARGLSAGFNRTTASDLGVAVQSAMTGVRGGVLSVAANLRYLNEGPVVDDLRRCITEVEQRAEEAFAAAWPVVRDLAVAIA